MEHQLQTDSTESKSSYTEAQYRKQEEKIVSKENRQKENKKWNTVVFLCLLVYSLELFLEF